MPIIASCVPRWMIRPCCMTMISSQSRIVLRRWAVLIDVELADCRLAGARAADQGDAAAGLERKVEITDQRLVHHAVAKAEIAHDDAALELAQSPECRHARRRIDGGPVGREFGGFRLVELGVELIES